MKRLVAALLLGLTAGGSLVYAAMPDKEPRACVLVRETTAEIFRVQGNLLSSAVARGDALDKDTYREHDDEVRRHLAELSEIEPRYNRLFDECEAS